MVPDIKPTRQERRRLAAENKTWPDALSRVPDEFWPQQSIIPRHRQPTEVWRSREFLLQVFPGPGGVERLSVLRTQHDGKRFLDGITWDELQRLKSECGRGDRDAVEIYPRDADVVNVANMRHLWVMPGMFPLTWRSPKTKGSTPA